MEKQKSSVLFYILLALLILFATFATYYRAFVARDFEVSESLEEEI
jgi:hypothetical protein